MHFLLYCSSAVTQLQAQEAQEGEGWMKSEERTCTGRTSTHFVHTGWQRITPTFSSKKFHTDKGNSDVKLRIYIILSANWLVFDFHGQPQISSCKMLAIFSHIKALLCHPKPRCNIPHKRTDISPLTLCSYVQRCFYKQQRACTTHAHSSPQHLPLLKRKRFTKEL